MSESLQQPAFPPLVVSSNPEGTERVTRPSFVFAVGLAVVSALVGVVVAALSASTGDFGLGVISAAPFILIFCYALALSIHSAHVRGAQSIRHTVLVLDGAGFRGIVAQGEVTLPWAAIDRISSRTRGKHRIITFHFSPTVTPTNLGVHTSLAPKTFAAMRKQGFQVGGVAIDTPLDTLAAASSAFTGGRLAVI